MNNPLKLDNIYELIYVPKAFVVISKVHCFDFQKYILKHLYDDIIAPIIHPLKETSLYNLPRELLTVPIDQLDTIDYHQPFQGNHLVEIPPASGFPVAELYMSVIFDLFRITDKSEHIILSKQKFAKILPDDKKKSKDGHQQQTGIKAISTDDILSFVVPDQIIFYIPNFAFRVLFRKLSLINIVRLITNILLERQIIIFSENPADTTILCESLLYLLTPVTWNCIYIPFMPIELWETLNAMMPYIVGIPKKYKKFVRIPQKLTQFSSLLTVDRDQCGPQRESRGWHWRKWY